MWELHHRKKSAIESKNWRRFLASAFDLFCVKFDRVVRKLNLEFHIAIINKSLRIFIHNLKQVWVQVFEKFTLAINRWWSLIIDTFMRDAWWIFSLTDKAVRFWNLTKFHWEASPRATSTIEPTNGSWANIIFSRWCDAFHHRPHQTTSSCDVRVWKIADHLLCLTMMIRDNFCDISVGSSNHRDQWIED